MVPVGAGRGSHNASAVGRDALDVALQDGGTQFGRCPKTVAGPSNSGRRVIIGNLGNLNPGKPVQSLRPQSHWPRTPLACPEICRCR